MPARAYCARSRPPGCCDSPCWRLAGGDILRRGSPSAARPVPNSAWPTPTIQSPVSAGGSPPPSVLPSLLSGWTAFAASAGTSRGASVLTATTGDSVVAGSAERVERRDRRRRFENTRDRRPSASVAPCNPAAISSASVHAVGFSRSARASSVSCRAGSEARAGI